LVSIKETTQASPEKTDKQEGDLISNQDRVAFTNLKTVEKFRGAGREYKR
jgi:hypothetical protein